MSVDKTHQAFLEIVEQFNSNELPILELRPKGKDLVSSYRGDHDYFFNPESLRAILGLINKICTERKVSYLLKQSKTSKFRFELIGDRGKIVMELWPVIELNLGRNRRLGYRIITWPAFEQALKGDTGSSNLKEVLLSLIYVTHLYYRRKKLAANEVQSRLATFKERIKEGSNEEDYYSGRALELLDSLHNNQISMCDASTCANKLMEEMNLKKSSLIKSQHEKWRHRFHYWSTRKLLNLIPVVGPDGSGKSTLISEVITEYGSKSKKNSIRFKSIYMLFPIYKWNLKRLNRTHRNLKPNKTDEYMINTVLLISLTVFAAFIIFRRVIFARKTIIDRYFYDYLLVPLRNPGTPKKIPLYRLYTCLIPATRFLVVLNCSTDQILMRKKELSQESIEALMNLYLDQIVKKRVPEVLFCQTEEELSASKTNLAKFIYNK